MSITNIHSMKWFFFFIGVGDAHLVGPELVMHPLPDNEDDYEPSENSESGSSEYTTWSAARTDNSGARAMNFIAMRQQDAARRNPPLDAFIGVSNSQIASSPAYSAVGLPERPWELWDPYQEHDQHPDCGRMWKRPSMAFLVAQGVCEMVGNPRYLVSLFKKTPEEHMTNYPWWRFPHVEDIKDINLPPSRHFAHIRLSPNLSWAVQGRGVTAVNVRLTNDGAMDLKAIKEHFGMDNIMLDDRARGRYFETVEPEVMSNIARAVLANQDERIGPERLPDDLEPPKEQAPAVYRICEHHDEVSWELRLFRNGIRLVARNVLFIGSVALVAIGIASLAFKALLHFGGNFEIAHLGTMAAMYVLDALVDVVCLAVVVAYLDSQGQRVVTRYPQPYVHQEPSRAQSAR